MERQLVKTEKQIAKGQTGLIALAGSLVGKITGLVNKSVDKTQDKDYLSLDLFSQMTYMAAISSAGLARSQIFESAAQLPYSSSSYFKEVNFLVHKLNYDYPEACRVVGENTDDPDPRAILLRMAGTLSSGEPEHIFLAREAFVQGETYSNAYERDLQSLKSWNDAYVSLILSASLVLIIGVISMMIYPVQTGFVVLLAGMAILITVVGSWIIHRASPKEIKTHSLPDRSRGQNLARGLFRLLIPAGLVICFILALLNVGLGWILLVASAMALPPGLVIIWDDRKIDKHDNDIAGVLRSLGSVAKAVQTTVSDAVNKLDIRSTASFQGAIKRLKARLQTGINTNLCWQKFVGETGSEHVHRSVKIFRDAVTLGADPEEAGQQSSLFAMKIALLRARRGLVASGFSWLCIAMHATTCGLMLFITGVLAVFAGAVEAMGALDAGEYPSAMPTFGFFGDAAQMGLFNTLIIMIILVFTVANAFAIKATVGGHGYKFLFYFSILAAISGAAIILTPHLVGMTLGTVAPAM